MIKQCLIIDDDLDDQEIFKMCVEAVSNDIHCKTVSDPTKAIAMLASDATYTPDYIFIDVNMPKMNGIECLQVLKGIERLATAKMYMYSTSLEDRMLEESKRLGATDFILKPSKTVELKERLRKIFGTVPETNS